MLFREQRAHSRALLANVVRERDALDQHFSYLSRFANDIVLLSDATGRIVNCNDRAVSAYGRPRDSLIGCTLPELCPPAVRAAGERGLVQALESGDSRFETWQHSTERGEFPVEISARTLEVDGEKFIQSIVRDISERRMAEQQLRASEARFRNTFDHSAVGIAHVSVDGRFIMVNQHFADLLGYSPQEMQEMEVWSLSFPEDLPRELQLGKALLAGERGDYTIEKRYRRKNGEALWAHLTVSAVRAESGQVEYLIGVVGDIGPRKQLELEVQRRSLLYRTLSETNRAIARAEAIDEVLAAACTIVVSGGLFSRAAVTRFDSGAGEPTVVAAAGPKAQELAGELLELQARSGIFPVLSGDASPDGTVVINDVETGPISANTRLACLRHDVRAFASLPLGDPMMPEGRFMVFAREADFFAGDTLDLLLDMARDLSVALARFRERAKRQMAERHAREVAQRMSTLVEAAPIPVYDIDPDGRVGELWNPAAERVFGWRREEVRGRLLPIVPEDAEAQAEFAAVREKVLAGERFAGVELLRRRRDGSPVYISLSTALIPGSTPTILSVAEDITSRHDAAEAVRRARDELELRVAERTAELSAARDRAEESDRIKTAFLANMSHELRTPLNSIIGFSSLLLSGAPGTVNEEQGKQLAIVRHAGERLLTLIEDILDISRLQAVDAMLPREPAPLRDLVLRAVDTLRPQAAGRGLYMETDIEPCVALAEPRRLEQVLLNLLSNAVKYTDTGGVRVKCRGVGEHVEIAVEDTGFGISAQEQARLFVPFSQLKRTDSGREGTGLGLAISRRLVEAMGGSISVDSEPGRGSIFTVRLDAARAS
nr:PAS domain S-box protein [Wenzhouxiangella sp. XN24]